MTSRSTDVPAPPITFSVVIAVRDGVQTLQACLDSVYGQSHGGWELVVMDGASIDGTKQLLERESDRIAYWESERDRGISHAWNKALARIRGEWVIFLGADDRLSDREVLGSIAPILNSLSPDCRVAYGRVRVVSRGSGPERTYGRPWREVRRDFRLGMTIPHQATLHRRTLFEQHGEFDEGFRIGADYELLMRELLHAEPTFIDRVIADMGAGGISDRVESRVEIARETHRARFAHGLTRTPEWRSLPLLRARVLATAHARIGPRFADGLSRVYRRVKLAAGR